MPLPTTYNTGTATIAANDVAVTGQNTTWATSGIQAGDMFMAAGLTVPIASVNSNTSLTLADPWPGAARNNASYRIQFTPDATRVLASTRAVLDALTNGVLYAIASLQTAANKIAYFTGQGTAALADFTGFGRTLVGAADQAAGRSALGLGTAAVLNTGTSGAAVARLDGVNVWGQQQAISTGAYAQYILNAGVGTNGAGITGLKGGITRWLLYVGSPSAENGTNVGSDFELHRFDDAGNWDGSPFSVNRKTGLTTIQSLSLATSLAVGFGGTGGSTPASARTGLGLGSAAVEAVGTSGNAVAKLNGQNTWSQNQALMGAGYMALSLGSSGSNNVELSYYRNNLARWSILVGSGQETGGNVESNLLISRFNDAGAYISSPMGISRATGVVSFEAPPKLPSYTVSTVPSAAAYPQGLIYVSNGTGNKRLAISDGSSWRFPDGGAVS